MNIKHPINIINRPSPNFDERNAEVNMLILHYTGMKTGAEAISRLCDVESRVSSHYVLEENGDLFQLVDESKRAWHSGISYWSGMRNVNANSIGIEIVNPGHEFGYRAFTEAQYVKLIDLCKSIKKTYGIPDINIVAHSDIAPDRKEDPGELFDWERLAQAGIGLWATPEGGFADDLTQLGYEFHNEKSITAFQRHWRQSLVNGQWDEECCQILHKLIGLAGR